MSVSATNSFPDSTQKLISVLFYTRIHFVSFQKYQLVNEPLFTLGWKNLFIRDNAPGWSGAISKHFLKS